MDNRSKNDEETVANPGSKQNYNNYAVRKRGDLSTASSFTGNNTNGAMAFQLTDMPKYTKFTDIFDQYKIRKVIVRFR